MAAMAQAQQNPIERAIAERNGRQPAVCSKAWRQRRPAIPLGHPAFGLCLQESLNGNSSEPYLRAITPVARVFETNGDPARVLALYWQAVRIADVVAARPAFNQLFIGGQVEQIRGMRSAHD
jgi:hypothetical protein